MTNVAVEWLERLHADIDADSHLSFVAVVLNCPPAEARLNCRDRARCLPHPGAEKKSTNALDSNDESWE